MACCRAIFPSATLAFSSSVPFSRTLIARLTVRAPTPAFWASFSATLPWPSKSVPAGTDLPVRFAVPAATCLSLAFLSSYGFIAAMA